MRITHRLACCVLFALWSCGLRAFDPASLPTAGVHPDTLTYYGSVQMANALHQSGEWLEFSNDWGTAVSYWGNSQFDTNGYPRFLRPGRSLRAIPYGLHNPENADIVTGQFVLTWQGDADVRYGGTFVPGKSNCGETGRAVNGRRVYRVTNNLDFTVTVLAIQSNQPITSMQLWLPDPADPMNRSLENERWHPVLLERMRDRDWGVLRTMTLQDINGNPQQDWNDRCLPSHIFMNPVLQPRAPAVGASADRRTGMAFEFLVDLCNRTSNDLWICVPHLATDAFLTNLARLIRFGSDGTNAYTAAVTTPVHPPLATNRRVFIEYSNEIWSSGDSFPQGDWAEAEGALIGLSKARFNARRFCDTWRIFQQVFGGTDRLVRVAATFTALQSYSVDFLGEMRTYGATLTPAVEPDVVAGTTYFGNGIQDWVHERAQAQALTADPWFYTGATFGSPARPVSLPEADPYWSGSAIERHITEAYDEWLRRLLAGDAREGGGPDAVGLGGGFDVDLVQLAATNFASPKPLIAYEGGPSIYTDYMDGGDVRDDGITQFMAAMNRDPRIRTVYDLHLNVSKSKGLWMHMPFVLCSSWGKFGQWGHLEYSSQQPADAPKYQFILDWAAEMEGIRPVSQPLGGVPSFGTAPLLPPALARSAYSNDILTTGGEGARALKQIAQRLTPGLEAYIPADQPDRIRITGHPSEPGFTYISVRVTDADGDASWRTFTLPVVGGVGTVIESDFRGTDPALNLPWTSRYTLAHGLASAGWTRGTGILTRAGSDGIHFAVTAPSAESDATLALAIADREYLALTLQMPTNHILDLAGASCRMGLQRLSWHAPRRFAVLDSVAGFADTNALFISDREEGDTSDLTYTFQFPTTAAYRAISGAFECRIYGFSGQFSGHTAALIDFKITSPANYAVRPAMTDSDADGLDDAWELRHFGSITSAVAQADADLDGLSNRDEFLAGTDPRSSGSAFRFQVPAASVTGLPLQWSSVTGAVYAIEGRTNLIDGDWLLVRGGIPAVPPMNTYTTGVGALPAYYRIVLEGLP